MSNVKIFWYVLLVRTGAEERLVEKLKDKLGGDGYLPFVPQKTCIFRRQGKKSEFQKICFPGYVFVESDRSAAEFIKYALPIVYKIQGTYRFLNYGDKFDIVMLEEERAALSRVLGNDHCIDISKGFKEGDSVRVISGPLVGDESKIMRINKGRGEAVIAMNLFGTKVSVSVGLEVIEKINEN